MKSLLLLLLTLSPVFAQAQAPIKADCLSQEQVNSFFSTYKLYNWSEEQNDYVVTTTIPDLCNSDDVAYRLVKTNEYMKALNSFQNPMSSSIVFREGASNYFTKRIKEIVIEPSPEKPSPDDSCPPGVIAYVYMPEKDVMHICTAGFSRFNTLYMMTYVLVHEARHTEGYGHVDCNHGPYSKSEGDGSIIAACDANYESQGSYGIGAGFLLEVAKNSINPVEKQDARSRAVVDMVQRFNKLPLGIKPGLVAQSQSGEISFFEGAKRELLTQIENPESKMTFRAGLPTFFDSSRGTVLTYSYQADLTEGEGEYAKNYVALYTPSERESFRDAYYGDANDYSCLLFDHKIECRDIATDEKMEYAFQNINARQFFAEEGVLHILSEEGMIYALPKTWKELNAWSKSTVAVLEPASETSSNVKSIASFNNGKTEYAVTINGVVTRFDKKTKSWLPVQEFKGENVEKIVAPFYWSKKLESL